jgi:hypothetical protein
MTPQQVKQMTTGAVLLTLGVILLANALDVRHVWRAWPVVFFLAGVPRLLAGPTPDDRWNGISLVGTGTVFLLHTTSLLRLRDSWPLFLIGFGISLLIRRPQPPVARTKES